MTSEYFYVPPESIHPPALTVTGAELTHLTHVMRMREGDAIRVVDGKGVSYEALITSVSRHEATCRITSRTERLHEPSRMLTIGAGMLKNPSRFDYLVEKATELGAGCIVPLITERTIPRHARTERWQKLCVAAMKQSGRCVLPEVGQPTTFGEFIASADPRASKFLPHGGSEGTFPAFGTGPVVVCIGPEGGFSEQEVAAATEAGFQRVSLGARRLRTETAAVAACAALLLGG